MNIDNLTYGQIKEISTHLASTTEVDKHPYKIGRNYLIRTVTMILVGRLETVFKHELVLSAASWIPDTGRFHECLKTGSYSEAEPFYKDAIIGRHSLIDCTEWPFDLPKEEK